MQLTTGDFRKVIPLALAKTQDNYPGIRRSTHKIMLMALEGLYIHDNSAGIGLQAMFAPNSNEISLRMNEARSHDSLHVKGSAGLSTLLPPVTTKSTFYRR
jgi:hypothetical protein